MVVLNVVHFKDSIWIQETLRSVATLGKFWKKVRSRVGIYTETDNHIGMKSLIHVDEAKKVCQDRSNWIKVVFAYPCGKEACRYVCMYLSNPRGIRYQ